MIFSDSYYCLVSKAIVVWSCSAIILSYPWYSSLHDLELIIGYSVHSECAQVECCCSVCCDSRWQGRDVVHCPAMVIDINTKWSVLELGDAFNQRSAYPYLTLSFNMDQHTSKPYNEVLALVLEDIQQGHPHHELGNNAQINEVNDDFIRHVCYPVLFTICFWPCL